MQNSLAVWVIIILINILLIVIKVQLIPISNNQVSQKLYFLRPKRNLMLKNYYEYLKHQPSRNNLQEFLKDLRFKRKLKHRSKRSFDMLKNAKIFMMHHGQMIPLNNINSKREVGEEPFHKTTSDSFSQRAESTTLSSDNATQSTQETTLKFDFNPQLYINLADIFQASKLLPKQDILNYGQANINDNYNYSEAVTTLSSTMIPMLRNFNFKNFSINYLNDFNGKYVVNSEKSSNENATETELRTNEVSFTSNYGNLNQVPISNSSEKEQTSLFASTTENNEPRDVRSTSLITIPTFSGEKNILAEQDRFLAKILEDVNYQIGISQSTESITNNTQISVAMRARDFTDDALSSSTENTLSDKEKLILEKQVKEERVLNEILKDIQDIRVDKMDATQIREGMFCSGYGSWVSEAMGKIITLSKKGDINTVTVGVCNCTPPQNINLLDSKCLKLSAEIPFEHSGLLYLVGVDVEEKRIFSFVGECKTCDGMDLITGDWLVRRESADCKDQKACQTIYSDIWRKERLNELREAHLSKIEQNKISNNLPSSSTLIPP